MKNQLFSGKCFQSGGFMNLTPKDAYSEAINNDAVFIDVREEYLTKYKRFDVPQIVYIPLSDFENRLNELPEDMPLILADATGLRSHEAMIILIDKGIQNIANLAGGIVEWERDGLPLDTTINEQLTGSCMCQLRPWQKKK